MTAEQVEIWFAFANRRLDDLRLPVEFWGQISPMPAMFCDGHGTHQIDLQELRQALHEARERLLSKDFGEDGPDFGVTAQQHFIEIFGIIANAGRVGGEQ
jgi:hypothetical protein